MASTGSPYAKPFPEGLYIIRHLSRATSVVDLGGTGFNDVVANCKDDRTSQQWNFKFGTKGYKIKNLKTQAYLSYPVDKDPANNVIVTANHHNPVEWVFRKTAPGYMLLLASNNNIVLTLYGNSPKENAKIGLWQLVDLPDTRWDCDLVPGSDIFLSSRARIEMLETSIEDLKGQLTKSTEDTQNRLNLIEESVARAQGDIAAGQESVADIRNQLSTVANNPGLTKMPPSPAQTSPISTGQLIGLGQKFPALEARTERLAKSFGQTQDYLVGVQKFLQTMRSQLAALDQAVPAVEAKADNAVESLGQEVRGLLEALDERVALVEGRTSDLSDVLGKICHGGAYAAVGGSPVTFPSHDTLDTPGPLSVLELEAIMSTPLVPSPSLESTLPPLPERFQ